MSAWEASSETTAEVVGALVAALGDMADIVKDRTAKVEMKQGGTFAYSYADLASALETARPVLKQHGLAVSQPPAMDGTDVVVRTVIMHTSGEWLSFPAVAMPSGPTAQNKGSAITYARRYSLMAILGLATEDDDGAGAGERQAPVQRAQEPTFSAEAHELFKELSAAAVDVKQAVKAFAQSRNGSLTLAALDDPVWAAEVRNAIDEAKSFTPVGVEQPELAAQQ